MFWHTPSLISGFLDFYDFFFISVGCTICLGLFLAIPIAMIVMGKYVTVPKYTVLEKLQTYAFG